MTTINGLVSYETLTRLYHEALDELRAWREAHALQARVTELERVLRVTRGSAELRPDGTTVREIDEVLQKTQQLAKPERVTCERCGSRYVPGERHGCAEPVSDS